MFFIYQAFLLAAHFTLDFGYFLTPEMLKAKDTGSPLFPIAKHALAHTLAMSIIIAMFCPNVNFLTCIAVAASIEFFSHWFIDTMKGKIGTRFPALKDSSNPLFWHLFALDQFLHVTIIIAISNLTLIL